MNSDDTISKDPMMQEAARRAASEASLPHASYDTKTIAHEEFVRRVDPKYSPKNFEELWESLTAPFKPLPKPEDVATVLTEAEYRQVCAALMRGVNSVNLKRAGDEEQEKVNALQRATTVGIEDRCNDKEVAKKVGESFPDLLNGTMRLNVAMNIQTCPLHPNGCPDEDNGIAIPFSVGRGGDIRAALAAAITGLMNRKK